MSSDRQSQEPAPNGRALLSRRGLFELAALAIASSALPSGPGFARPSAHQDQPHPSPAISPLMLKLSGYMSQAAVRPLPDEVVEGAKHHILDTFAAMISGSGLPPGHAALQFARAYGGKEVATVVASKTVCGPI